MDANVEACPLPPQVPLEDVLDVEWGQDPARLHDLENGRCGWEGACPPLTLDMDELPDALVARRDGAEPPRAAAEGAQNLRRARDVRQEPHSCHHPPIDLGSKEHASSVAAGPCRLRVVFVSTACRWQGERESERARRRQPLCANSARATRASEPGGRRKDFVTIWHERGLRRRMAPDRDRPAAVPVGPRSSGATPGERRCR
jgi:hypothetical protein